MVASHGGGSSSSSMAPLFGSSSKSAAAVGPVAAPGPPEEPGLVPSSTSRLPAAAPPRERKRGRAAEGLSEEEALPAATMKQRPGSREPNAAATTVLAADTDAAAEEGRVLTGLSVCFWAKAHMQTLSRLVRRAGAEERGTVGPGTTHVILRYHYRLFRALLDPRFHTSHPSSHPSGTLPLDMTPPAVLRRCDAATIPSRHPKRLPGCSERLHGPDAPGRRAAPQRGSPPRPPPLRQPPGRPPPPTASEPKPPCTPRLQTGAPVTRSLGRSL